MKPTSEPAGDRVTSSPHGLASKLRLFGLVGLGLCIIVWLFRGFLWQVLQALMLNVLPILFTPVILELTVGFAGLFVVLLFCHLRRKDQEDEWVYISQVEPESEMESIPEPLRKRVGETVLKSKPVAVDVNELPLQAIEGLLDLGLLDDVEKELGKASPSDQRLPGFVRLRLMLLLRLQQWEEAASYARSRPAAAEKLAVNCVEVARFFVNQKPALKEPARQCLELGKKLSVSAVVNAIDADGRLQKLA